MSSLSQKLAMFQSEIKKENDQEARQEIDRIPMARLKDVTIAFGKAKLGLKFSEAFQDQSWTKWFVATYENSPKIERLHYLRYVSLRVEEGASNLGLPSSSETKEPTYLRHSAQDKGAPMVAPPLSDPWDVEEHQLGEILSSGHQAQ